MKKIIKINEVYGDELHTRQIIERLKSSLNSEDDYLLDMRGVQRVSRSAADELYNLTHTSKRVEIINLEPYVEKMLSAVVLGRFLPRHYEQSDVPIINCATIDQAATQLSYTPAL